MTQGLIEPGPYRIGRKLKPKSVERYAAMAREQLLPDEEVRAFYRVNRLRPTTVALLITTHRVFGIKPSCEVFQIALGTDVTDIEITAKRSVCQLQLSHAGRTESFGVEKDDIATLEQDIRATTEGTREVAQLLAAQREEIADRDQELQARTIGRVGKKVLEEARQSCRPGEIPEFILGSGAAGGLVAFADRCMIVKKGPLTGLMAGSVGGGRVATFMYAQITGIEYNAGWISGVLEILTPSYQGTANKDYWRGTFRGRNKDSNDPWTLSNTLPLPRQEYEAARRYIDRLRELVTAAKTAPLPTSENSSTTENLASELAKLAELHTDGALDDEEFREAKRALITRLSGGSTTSR